jgi:hypothetical protein
VTGRRNTVADKHPLLKSLRVVILIVSSTFSAFPQTPEITSRKIVAQERAALLSELASLEKETLEFHDPLAEAAAKAEIAAAAWQLDKEWAKTLMRVAYKLALPAPEQDPARRQAGSIPRLFGGTDFSRLRVRRRILDVARSDKEFVDELIQTEGENTGAFGKHFMHGALADQAMGEGDVASAAGQILQGIKADPTQTTAPDIINRVSMRDRALADRLILQYIAELRKFQLSSANQSDIRARFILNGLMNPYTPFDPHSGKQPERIPPPGPEVMRAYVTYMLEVYAGLEQREPGYIRMWRRPFLSLWIPLQRYAPDLAPAFLNLEARGRSPEQRLTLPTAAGEKEAERARYERSLKNALESDTPDEGVIYRAISRGDFDKARKMIDKLPDDARKKHLLEMANEQEAVSLAAKGNVDAAEALAKELRTAASIVAVYPALIKKAVADKDKLRATGLVYQALQQVEKSDNSAPPPPPGIPASAVAGDGRFNPVLTFTAKLATELLPFSDELAFDVLDRLVSFANSTPLESERSQLGFDLAVIKKLAPRNEERVQQAAYALRNRVQRVLALAALYQWEAERLTAKQAALKP